MPDLAIIIAFCAGLVLGALGLAIFIVWTGRE